VDLDAEVAVVVDVDVIANGVNSILTVESSRETKKFRVIVQGRSFTETSS
jgi:hypothetical protein